MSLFEIHSLFNKNSINQFLYENKEGVFIGFILSTIIGL